MCNIAFIKEAALVTKWVKHSFRERNVGGSIQVRSSWRLVTCCFPGNRSPFNG